MTVSDTGTRRRGDEETPAPPRPSFSRGGGARERGGAPARHSSRPGALTPRALSRLSHLLTAKSLAEALFLAALVTAFSYSHFYTHFRGSLDVADAHTVGGWAVDEAAPEAQVEVELYIDGHFVARRRADAPRADVLAAGRAASAYHGYVFETPRLPPRAGEYEARVFAAHTGADSAHATLQQVGEAKRFRVAPTADNAHAPEAWWEESLRR
ncbi:MAG TPA: hypothetical protein VF538_01505 [Pyrinomonadaceae bacterium]